MLHKNEEKTEQNSASFRKPTSIERGLRPNGYFPLMRQPRCAPCHAPAATLCALPLLRLLCALRPYARLAFAALLSAAVGKKWIIVHKVISFCPNRIKNRSREPRGGLPTYKKSIIPRCEIMRKNRLEMKSLKFQRYHANENFDDLKQSFRRPKNIR